VPLPWTHGYYGTFLEKQTMLQLHDWFFPFLLITATGSAIQQLHKKKEPWTKKQFWIRKLGPFFKMPAAVTGEVESAKGTLPVTTYQELGTVLWENRLYPRGSEEEPFRPGECVLTLAVAARREVLPSLFNLVASVCFSLLSVQASGAQHPQENPQSRYFIERVELIGNRRIEAETLLARISSRPGGPYSVGAVRRDVQALWSTQFFDDVRFEVEDSRDEPNGKIVMFSVKEKSDIARIATAQAQTIPEQIWSGAGTSFWSPELNRFYVAAPAHDNEETAILVFEPQP
jgi:hypothetical protein